ncbi:uncharacterized protein LOC144620615 [Crassostrea virginica]
MPSTPEVKHSSHGTQSLKNTKSTGTRAKEVDRSNYEQSGPNEQNYASSCGNDNNSDEIVDGGTLINEDGKCLKVEYTVGGPDDENGKDKQQPTENMVALSTERKGPGGGGGGIVNRGGGGIVTGGGGTGRGAGEIVTKEGAGGIVTGEGAGGIVTGEGAGGIVIGEGAGGIVTREGAGGIVTREGAGGIVTGEGAGGIVTGGGGWKRNPLPMLSQYNLNNLRNQDRKKNCPPEEGVLTPFLERERDRAKITSDTHTLSTCGLKRKLKTHTIETKFHAIADVERGTISKAAISKKYEC